MPFSKGGTHQDLLGGASVAGLQSVAAGKVSQETVMISQLVDNAFRRFPDVVNRPDHLTKERLLHRGSRNERQIMSCRVVAGIVQSIGVFKGAVCCSPFCRPAISLFSKSLHLHA